MAKPKKLSAKRKPLPLTVNRKPSTKISEPTLLWQRIQELDREFARQTMQLTEITKRLGEKISKKLK